MTKPKHTPTPWEINGRNNTTIQVYDPTEDYSRTVAECGLNSSLDADHEANAVFILRACNSYYNLVSTNKINRDVMEKIKKEAEYSSREDFPTVAALALANIFKLLEGAT